MHKFIGETILNVLNLIQYVALLLVIFYLLFPTKIFSISEIKFEKGARKKKILRMALLILFFGGLFRVGLWGGGDGEQWILTKFKCILYFPFIGLINHNNDFSNNSII